MMTADDRSSQRALACPKKRPGMCQVRPGDRWLPFEDDGEDEDNGDIENDSFLPVCPSKADVREHRSVVGRS